MREGEDRVERQDDGVLVVKGQTGVMIVLFVGVMPLHVAVNEQLVVPMLLRLMDMLHRRPWEGGETAGKDGGQGPGR